MSRQELTHGAAVLIAGRMFHAGSARGYAEQYKEDGAAAERQCIERGHETHWLTPDAAVLCADRGFYEREQAKRAAALRLEIDELVRFEGRTFRLVNAPNRNVRLEAVGV